MTSLSSRSASAPGRSLPILAPADAEKRYRSRFAIAHTSRFRNRRYAYFPRTSDLAQVSDPIADALQWFVDGVSWWKVGRQLQARYGRALAVAALHSLKELRNNGYLDQESVLSPEKRATAVESLLGIHPRNLMLFVTEACNLKCTYCYEVLQGVHAGGRMLKQVDARAVVDQYLADSGNRSPICITFFGGEPLLNFKVIADVVQYAKEGARGRGKAIAFSMTTNLTLLTEEIADYLVEEQFSVMVSLDGSSQKNDSRRVTVNGSGTYERVTRNLRMLMAKQRKAGVRLPRLRATMSEGNSDGFAIEEDLLALGTGLVMVGGTQGTVDGKGDHDLPSDDSVLQPFRAYVDSLLERLRNGEPVGEVSPMFLSTLSKVHEELTRELVHAEAHQDLCGVCRNMKAVSTNGDLFPCHRYVGMDEFKVGNVHEGGAKEELVKEYYEKAMEPYHKKCVDCWARYLCGGQCPWYLSRSDGTVDVPDKPTCEGIRAGFDETLGMYAVLASEHPVEFERLLGTAAAAVTGNHDCHLQSSEEVQ